MERLPHWCLTDKNPAFYDTESATAIEQTAKIYGAMNELIDETNTFTQTTNEHIANYEQSVDNKLQEQDDDIANQKAVVIPATIKNEVQNHIENGAFDEQIDKSLNHLNERVDSLLGKVKEGTSTMDAEIIDTRTDWKGRVWENSGQAARKNQEELFDNGLCTPLIPSHFVGIFGTIDSSTKAKTARVALTSNGEGVLGLYASYYGLGRAGKTYSFTLDTDSDFTLYVRTDENGISYGNTATFEFFHKNENVVKFKTNEDFNVIIIRLSDNPESAELAFSLVENAGPTWILPQQLSENIIGFSHYLSDILWYGLLSNATYNSSNRLGGLYVHNLTYTPNEGITTHALITQYNLKVGTPYQIIMQGIPVECFNNIMYRTQPSWGVGEGATLKYGTNYNEESKTLFIDFIITNNDVAADRLLLRFTNLAESVQIRIGIMELYEKAKILEGKEYIAFCGDSLTAQQYFTHIVTDKSKIGFGVGGEGISGIFARTGVEPLYVESESILPGTNVIELSLTGLFNQGMGNINPVTIAGIEGTLSLTDGTYYFTPTEEIEETRIFRPLLIPNQSNLNISMFVYWIGTNNLGSWTPEQIFAAWEKVLAVYPNSLILGLTNDSSDTALEKVLALDELGAKLGNRFVPLHNWLVNYGLDYCGLTATAEDTAAIAAGKIPPQLLSDKVHFNENGKKCVSYLVSERLKVFNAL